MFLPVFSRWLEKHFNLLLWQRWCLLLANYALTDPCQQHDWLEKIGNKRKGKATFIEIAIASISVSSISLLSDYR